MIKIPTFLKWAGGKRNIINQLDPLIPQIIDRYFEPFLGGGFFFFYVKKKYNPTYCMISDINKDLIDTYRAVRDYPARLIYHLRFFKRNDSTELFYKVRKDFNEHKIRKIKRCAAFIYLNKTCYNGLYRVNKKGRFNVPYGKYKDPEIFNKETVMEASRLLQGVVIKHQDYRRISSNIKKGDFIYLDPCYDPIKRTSFANYTPKRFCEVDRIELSKFIRFIITKEANFLLSNNSLPIIKSIYSDLKITEIKALRMINSDALERGKVIELAISN